MRGVAGARFLIAGGERVTGTVFAAGTAPRAGNLRVRCGAPILPLGSGARAKLPRATGFRVGCGALGNGSIA